MPLSFISVFAFGSSQFVNCFYMHNIHKLKYYSLIYWLKIFHFWICDSFWHHRLDGHGFRWTPGAGDGQGGLVCCGSWGRKELDTTEGLNWTELALEIGPQNPQQLQGQWAKGAGVQSALSLPLCANSRVWVKFSLEFDHCSLCLLRSLTFLCIYVFCLFKLLSKLL